MFRGAEEQAAGQPEENPQSNEKKKEVTETELAYQLRLLNQKVTKDVDLISSLHERVTWTSKCLTLKLVECSQPIQHTLNKH